MDLAAMLWGLFLPTTAHTCGHETIWRNASPSYEFGLMDTTRSWQIPLQLQLHKTGRKGFAPMCGVIAGIQRCVVPESCIWSCVQCSTCLGNRERLSGNIPGTQSRRDNMERGKWQLRLLQDVALIVAGHDSNEGKLSQRGSRHFQM